MSTAAIAGNVMEKSFTTYHQEQQRWLIATSTINPFHRCGSTTLTSKGESANDNIDCNATTTMSTT
jgi:hypothetical protein